jgi:predicted DNA-binding transcriptional regulator AlpA
MSASTAQASPAAEVGSMLTNELLTAEEFARVLAVSKRTLFRLRSKGVIPPPVAISAKIVRWRTSDIRAYLDGLPQRKLRRGC